MSLQEEQQLKIKEDPKAVERYNTLKSLGKEILGSSDTIRTGSITDKDVERAKTLLAKSATETQPPVFSTYWEHIFVAPELGKKIAHQAVQNGLSINPLEIEFLLYLHDIGRFVTPGAYIRNDFMGDRLLHEVGVPKSVRDNLPPIGKLLVAAEELNFSEDQLTFQRGLDPEQMIQANKYFESLSPTQRIIDFADNLGKRGPNGLFDLQSFMSYLKSEESRYDQTSDWSSVHWAIPRRQAGAVLQACVTEKTVKWLEDLGVDLNLIRNSLLNYGPKFVVVVRHGELENPRGIVYNRDSVMEEKDIVHVSEEGKKQMYQLGTLLRNRGFHCVRIETSPEKRAQESAVPLRESLEITDTEINDGLDDVYGPGPYEERMTMVQLEAIGGNVYEESRWEKYSHERPEAIINRMQQVFWNMAKALHAGETGILISHGDPVAWLVNTFEEGKKPLPQELRTLMYPAKGEGVVTIVDSSNKIFTTYLLTTSPPEDNKRKIY